MHRITYKIGEHDLILETGKVAKQANGAVFASYAGSTVLATVCCSDSEVEGLDYVPLQVEYNEKHYAAGKIPGGFLKREGRPRDKEILVSRLIDRPLRPLFDKKFKREIQIVPTVISTDQVNPPDIIAMVASSAAVTISDIPFEGPVSAVRVGMVDGQMVVNPTFDQTAESELDIIVAGTKDGITMVEGGAQEVPEDLMIEAIEKAREVIIDLCKIQEELRDRAGKEKIEIDSTEKSLDLADEVRSYAYDKFKEAIFVKGKMERSAAKRKVRNEVWEHFSDRIDEEDKKLFKAIFEDMEYEIVRASILDTKVRTDGRAPDQIRPITCEVNVLPRTHGSSLFTRGETQALVVTTLGSVYDEKLIDDIDSDTRYDNFMLHYNFPPFSVGETGRLSTGRREIGHGHLAERAIDAVLPEKESFPYTLRIVSEILESNGSSSMATVCGSSLSLLSAGVPISKPVAGIAMGLVSQDDRTVILSDILGEEDHLGDMDFKVAGTEKGITAFQMDIKISGVTADIMRRALEQAREGRLYILDIMNQTISSPESSLSEYAPRIITMKIDQEKIGAVIGTGGKNIKGLSEKYDANINIDNDGKITIYGKTRENAENAEEAIKQMIEEPEVGRVYEGTVKRIMDFGAFVEILPGKEGLVHISKLSRDRVGSVTDVLQLEQEIPVKLVEIDKMGRLNLSYIDAIDPDGASKGGSRPQHKGGGKRHDSNRRRD
jgi:polyribonucleotide nucleotidyltransferase